MTRSSPSGSTRRSFLKVTGAGIAATSMAGCLTGGGNGGNGNGNGNGGNGNGNGNGGNGNGNGDGSDDPIVISSLQPLSGPFSVYGPRHRAGAEFAAQQINANGGVRDRNIEIRTVDTESSGQAAATAFTEHIEQDGAVAGIGPGSSEAAIRTRDVAEDTGVPIYMHAAGAVEVVPRDARYTFRTALPATPTAGRAQAQIIEENDYNNIGVIYEDGVWGDEYGAAVEEYFPDDINLTEETAPIPQTDFVPQLRNFPDDIEVFLGSAHPAGISSLYPQMYEVGIEPDLFLGAITPMEADYNALGDQIEESFASFNSSNFYSDDYAEVASTYLEETGDIFDHAQLNGWTAVQLIAQSIEEAGSADPEDIAAATHSTTFDLLYGSEIEYTEWGEVDNAVITHNSFNLGESPDHWPDVGFSPEEFAQSEPLPAYEPGALDI